MLIYGRAFVIKMEFDATHNIEVLTVSSNSAPVATMNNVVPLQIGLDLAKYPMFSRDERNKLRRPVRPIDRQRMRPWLMELLDLGNVFGLHWTNRHQGIFQISWRHASRLGWNLETDGDVFERWARHTGIYKEGDPPEPKRWKANFRCALHSLHDVVELTNAVERRGRNACRTYRFLQSNDEQSINRKRAKTRRVKELQEQLLHKKYPKEISPLIPESGSSEDILSDTESETSHQEKVVVEKLEIKPEFASEEFSLHHDHDYAGPDKTQKTIVLRHGIGSVVLHKEVHNPSDKADESENLLSNLNQLASAAMNSASIDSAELEESEKSSMGVKAGFVNVKEALLANESELKQSDFSVNYYFLDKKDLDDRFKSTRKRKLLTLLDQPVSINLSGNKSLISSSEQKQTAVCACPQKEVQLELSHYSLNARHRTDSPKIFCRRSKHSGEKNEKIMSELAEPLMSSCLLLLEAATRLDNAEKIGKTNLSSNLNTSKINHTIVQKAPFHNIPDLELGKHKANLTTKGNIIAQPSQAQQLVHDTNTSKSNTNMSSFEPLRTTLENSKKCTSKEDSLLQSETLKNISTELTNSEVGNAVSCSSNVSFENTSAKGLFSGSNIHTDSSFSLKDKKTLTLFKNKLLENDQQAVKHESESKCSSSDVDHLVSEAHITTSLVQCSKGKFVVITSETKKHQEDFNNLGITMSSSSSPFILQDQLHGSEKILVIDKSTHGIPLCSTHASREVSFSSTLGIAFKKESLQSSDCLFPEASPSTQSIIMVPSCQAALSFSTSKQLLNTTPIYSQAHLTVSKSESVSLHSEAENKNSADVLPAELFTNSSTISSDQTLILSTQEQNVFANEQKRSFDDEIKFHVLSLPSYFMLGKTQTQIEHTIPTVGCVDTIVHKEPVVLNESKGTNVNLSSCSPLSTSLQIQSPRQSTSTKHKVEEESIVPIIINRTKSTVHDVDTPNVILQKASSSERNNACKLFMNVDSGKPTPLLVLTEISSDLIESVSCPEDSSMAVLNSSSNDSLQQTVHNCNVSSHSELHNSSFLSQSDESLSVKSLSELCKKHLAHMFLTLDHQTCESDDSVTETPNLELTDRTYPKYCGKNNLQAVTLPLQHSLQCETESNICGNKYDHSSCNTTIIPKQNSTILLLSSNSEFHSEGSTINQELVGSISENILRPLPETTKSLDIFQNIEQKNLLGNRIHVETNYAANAVNLSSPALIDEAQLSGLTVDPTAPISIGEVPLFASSKSDSNFN